MKKKLGYLIVLGGMLAIATSCKNEDEKISRKPSEKETLELYTKVKTSLEGLDQTVDVAFKDTTGNKGKRINTGCIDLDLDFNLKKESIKGFGKHYGKIFLNLRNNECNTEADLKGTIVIYFSGWMESWKDSVVFDYFHKGLSIKGYKVGRWNAQLSSWGSAAFNNTLVTSVTFADGSSYAWKSTETHKWTNIFTPVTSLEYSGKAILSHSDNWTIEALVTAPLLYKQNCHPAYKYPVKGTVDLFQDGVKSSINYGEGNCDREAVFTTSDGKNEIFYMN